MNNPALEHLEEIRQQIKQLEKERQAIDKNIDKLEKQLATKLQKLSESLGYALVPSKVTQVAKAPGGKSAEKKKATRAPAKIKYRDNNGNSWTGRGIRPKWLTNALNSGKTLSDFAV